MTAKNTGVRPVSVRTLAMHRACVTSDALQPKHASSAGEDGTWTQGLVASRPMEWQR
jgi:hypothetical protein